MGIDVSAPETGAAVGSATEATTGGVAVAGAGVTEAAHIDVEGTPEGTDIWGFSGLRPKT